MQDLFGHPIESNGDNNHCLKPNFRQWQLREGERLYHKGVSVLSNEELLAHLLRHKTAAERLLDKFGSLDNMASAYLSELMQVEGIGRAQAEKLTVAFELSRRLHRQSVHKIELTSPSAVAAVVAAEYHNLKQEVLKVLLLDAKSHLIQKQDVFIGTVNTSLCHPREVYRTAIKLSASSIIITHNHPSGNPHPSPDDKKITKQLVDAGNIIDIKLLDHIIFGDNGFWSMKEEGMI
jgi:DNA repair protein RadC